MTPSIALWGPDHIALRAPGNRQDCFNVLGRIANFRQGQSLFYSLNGQTEQLAAISGNWTRLSRRGDFNIEIPYTVLNRDSNDLTLSVRDKAGHEVSKHVSISVEHRSGPFLPIDVKWSQCGSVYDAGEPVDGHWQIEDGALTCDDLGYDRLFVIGDTSLTNYIVTVPMTIHRFDPIGFRFPSWGPGIGIITGWSGHHPKFAEGFSATPEPRTDWWPIGAIGWYRWRWRPFRYQLHMIGNRAEVLGIAENHAKIQPGAPFVLQMRVVSRDGGPNQYALRVWPEGTSPPHDWDLVVDGLADEQSRGAIALVAHHVDARFGDISVVPVSA